MSLATLLVYPSDPRVQAWFSFAHQMAHNSLVEAMSAPIPFNLANYLIDPTPPETGGGDSWMFAHQQAHDDAASHYGVQPSLNLLEQSPDSSPWWVFANFSEHMSLSRAAFLKSLG